MLAKKKTLYAIFFWVAVFLNNAPGRAQNGDWSNSYEDEYDNWSDYTYDHDRTIGIYINLGNLDNLGPEVIVYQHNPVITLDWPIVFIGFAPIWYRSTFYYYWPYDAWYEPFRPVYRRRIHVVWYDPVDFYRYGGFVYPNTAWRYPVHRISRWQRHFDWSPRYHPAHFVYHRQSPFLSRTWNSPAKNRPVEYARRRTDTLRRPVTPRINDNRNRRDNDPLDNRRSRNERDDRPGQKSENRSSTIEKRTKPQTREQQPPVIRNDTRPGDQRKWRQQEKPNTTIKQRKKTNRQKTRTTQPELRQKPTSDKRYTSNDTDTGKNRALDSTKGRNTVRGRNNTRRSNNGGALKGRTKSVPGEKSIRQNRNPVKNSPGSSGIRSNRPNQRSLKNETVRTRPNKSQSTKSSSRTAKSESSRKEKSRGSSSRQSDRSAYRR